jgi:hypothetical protein
MSDLIGWNPILQYKGEHPIKAPFVGCLSHTSAIHEFPLFYWYSQNEKFLKNACIIMAGKGTFHNEIIMDIQPMKWLSTKVNIIYLPTTKNSKGSVDRIVRLIKKGNYSCVVIDPGGKDTDPSPWRTGYYYIGKKLGWNYRVVGLDFEHKRFKIGPIVNQGLSIETTQNLLQNQMGDIVPIYPKNSLVAIRPHDPHNVSFISWTGLFLPTVWFIITILLLLHYTKRNIFMCLYGLYLQCNKDPTVNLMGMIFIYISFKK